jgi:hypothetical protein
MKLRKNIGNQMKFQTDVCFPASQCFKEYGGGKEKFSYLIRLGEIDHICSTCNAKMKSKKEAGIK